MDGRLVKCRVSFGLEGRVDRIGRKASRPIWRENERGGGGGGGGRGKMEKMRLSGSKREREE